MSLTLDLPPEVEAALAEAARQQGTTPEHLAADRLGDLYTPSEKPSVTITPEIIAWEAMFDSFDQGNTEEQKKTIEFLKTALDRDRPGQRSIFGEGTNPNPPLDYTE